MSEITITADPNYFEGTINGRPIAGYHFVQYGETQEYLESLIKEGVMLFYHEDNPPEEGKLTLTKPNPEPDPGTITISPVANPTEYIYGPYEPLQLTEEELIATLGPEKYEALINTTITATTPTSTADTTVTTTPETNKAYTLVPVAEGEDSTIPGYKLVLVDLTEEEIAAFNELPHGNIVLLSDEQIALILKAAQSYTDSLKEKETDATDTTVTDSTALIAGLKSYLEEIAPKMSDIDSLTDEEVASFNETLKSYKEALRQAGVATCLADTTLDPRTDTGMNLETLDPRTDTSLTALLDSYIAALDEKEATTTDTTVTDYHYGQDNWSIGENGELVYKDTTKYIKFTTADLPFCLTLIDNRGRMMGDMDPPGQESTPSYVTIEDLTPETRIRIPVSSDLVQQFEEAISIRQRLAERSKPVAFVSTMDAETEAVQSVQVACAEDGGWRTIGTLNPGGIDWKYQAGNLTGSGTASVVWHAQELGALGVWTDGTDNWTAVDGWFDANWSMLGCGDFDGDGKDSVLMSLYGGLFYSVDLDGTLSSLGDLNWSGWEFGAVGDFAGDGKDDVVLFHKELGCVVLLADGNTADYTSIGQLDASDWSIAGAGDFDGDGKADLVVRQISTGIAGAYASADMSKWSTVTTDYLLA